MVTNYTSQAWTGSHLDYFARNIITTAGDEAAITEAQARKLNEFRSNAVARTWPTVDELVAWLDAGNYGPTVNNPEAAQWALDAAIDDIAEGCGLHVYPVDANGAVDQTADPVQIPPKVFVATLIEAAHLYVSPPTGVIGSNEIGGAVRVSSYAPGVDRLLRNHLLPGLA